MNGFGHEGGVIEREGYIQPSAAFDICQFFREGAGWSILTWGQQYFPGH